MVFGSAVRDSAVDVRSDGTTAIASAGRSVGDAPDLRLVVAPRDADAAAQYRGEVVDVRLEARAECELVVHGECASARRGSGDQAEADRGRARAEPTLEWDRVRETKPVSRPAA